MHKMQEKNQCLPNILSLGKKGLLNSQEDRIRRAYASLQILANNETATV
jgi:hypothetical protein